MKICFATNNNNKLIEIRKALGDEIEVLSLQDIGCIEELPENQNTIAGNSLEKASYVFNKYGVSCFADDTGLEIKCLNGEPGVYSARYAGTSCSSEENMKKVLDLMSSHEDRSAQFKTIITYISENGHDQFEGIVEGNIRNEKSGAKGFGYDPIFEPVGYNITFAEMDIASKNAISHRGIAVRKFIEFIKKTHHAR